MSLLRRTPPEERIPSPGRGQLLRGALGGLIILLLTSAAVATAALLQVSDIVDDFNPDGGIPTTGLKREDVGKAQTFLIIGSDRRIGEDKSRSDTMMLVRLDPDAEATTVLNLPRDLKVEIPGHGTDKLNVSYFLGGDTLTVRTIARYTGLDINHVINVNFGGFREVINSIGCVYIDVDRRYYHSNEGLPQSAHYAEIDLEPGYRKLCGTDALSYVRYRHEDSDIVRAARQQAFLRQAKDQLNSSSLIGKRDELLDIFSRAAKVDDSLKDSGELINVAKLGIFSAGHPVRQLEFPASIEESYVTATRVDVERTVEEFLDPGKMETEKDVDLTPESDEKRDKKPARPAKPSTSPSETPGLMNGKRMGEDVLASTVAKNNLGIPIYFPKYVTTSSSYRDPGVYVYKVADRAAKYRKSYRLVISHNVAEGQYWGVQGTDWPEPPILQGPHTQEVRHGRKLDVYRDGSRVHLVAWHKDGGTYWVKNTLSNALTNQQMLEIASTLTSEFG